MNYLETSFVRSVRFETIKKIKNRATSFKVFYELLSGIDSETEFEDRKHIILGLKKAGIDIDWRSTHAVIHKAFRFRVPDPDSDSIRRYVKIFDNSLSFAKLISPSTEDYTGIKLSQIVMHDSTSVSQFVSEELNEIRAFSQSSKESKKNSREFMKSDEVSALVRTTSEFQLRQLCSQFSLNFGIDGDRIAKRYDGSLDTFLDSCNHYFGFVVTKGNQSHSNTGHDLQHLLYVDGDDVVFSKDKIFSDIEKLGYIKVNKEVS